MTVASTALCPSEALVSLLGNEVGCLKGPGGINVRNTEACIVLLTSSGLALKFLRLHSEFSLLNMTINGDTISDHGYNGHTTEAPRLRIIIVGAGLSGLGAGIQSALSGHSVLILESARELGEVGLPRYNLRNSLLSVVGLDELCR